MGKQGGLAEWENTHGLARADSSSSVSRVQCGPAAQEPVGEGVCWLRRGRERQTPTRQVLETTHRPQKPAWNPCWDWCSELPLGALENPDPSPLPVPLPQHVISLGSNCSLFPIMLKFMSLLNDNHECPRQRPRRQLDQDAGSLSSPQGLSGVVIVRPQCAHVVRRLS